ncbi:MAG: glutamine-hydrolyzing GMP synthase [Crenarchaeota archaeon]|nr:glutamine-hydrolyzing GMP synthase [Thermoproteota archaeon]
MDKVAVIDLGGQYAHLIARRLRELGVYSELVYPEEIIESIEGYSAFVLSGGPSSVWEANHDQVAQKLIEENRPILGICYGHQLLAKVLGGKVGPSPKPEFGPTYVDIIKSEKILAGFPSRIKVWMSHNDAVLEPPPGVEVSATSEGSPVAAMWIGNVYSVQWHPEVKHTTLGRELLDNWIKEAGLKREWRPSKLIDELVEYVKRTVGDSLAIAAVSGGVDSTVASVIAYKAIGDNLIPVLIDHGLHPEGEVERVREALTRLGIRLKVVDYSEEFLTALEGISDPEEKRKVFGRVYAEVFEEIARSTGAEYLIQGTIYPDVIESGGRRGADVIKSHHNVGGLPERFGLKLVEPLRMFYKDEVRAIGRLLGLPDELLYKQPIPGPALAVRVEGAITRRLVEIARRANAIVSEEVERYGYSRELWQYFAVVTKSKATGVKGDKRAYGLVVAVRMVKSDDAMTAEVFKPDWSLLESIMRRITSEIPEVVRVVYDITSKPPATIEWE